MQPHAEDTRRRKNLTPKTLTTNSKSTATSSLTVAVPGTTEPKIRYPHKPKDNLPDIYANFTKQLRDAEMDNDDDDEPHLRLGESSKILEIIRNSPVVMDHHPQDTTAAIAKASASTTRRTLFNFFAPASQNTSTSQSSEASDVTIPETQELPVEKVRNQLDSPVKSDTPVRLTRRNSMSAKTQTVPATTESLVNSQEPSSNKTNTPGRLTRRNSFTTQSTPLATPAKTPRKAMRKTMFPSVEEEEPASDSSNMNLTNIIPIAKPQPPHTDQRTTCYAPSKMDVTPTPTALDSLNEIMTTPLGRERNTDTLLSSVLRRKTMYTPQVMEETFVEPTTQAEYASPISSAALASASVTEDVGKAKPVSRRRTLFTPNRVVAYRRDRILESEQLLNHSMDVEAGELFDVFILSLILIVVRFRTNAINTVCSLITRHVIRNSHSGNETSPDIE